MYPLWDRNQSSLFVSSPVFFLTLFAVTQCHHTVRKLLCPYHLKKVVAFVTPPTGFLAQCFLLAATPYFLRCIRLSSFFLHRPRTPRAQYHTLTTIVVLPSYEAFPVTRSVASVYFITRNRALFFVTRCSYIILLPATLFTHFGVSELYKTKLVYN